VIVWEAAEVGELSGILGLEVEVVSSVAAALLGVTASWAMAAVAKQNALTKKAALNFRPLGSIHFRGL